MSGKKAVDKVSKGLGSLIDEFASAVKEMVNAGEETVSILLLARAESSKQLLMQLVKSRRSPLKLLETLLEA